MIHFESYRRIMCWKTCSARGTNSMNSGEWMVMDESKHTLLMLFSNINLFGNKATVHDQNSKILPDQTTFPFQIKRCHFPCHGGAKHFPSQNPTPYSTHTRNTPSRARPLPFLPTVVTSSPSDRKYNTPFVPFLFLSSPLPTPSPSPAADASERTPKFPPRRP